MKIEKTEEIKKQLEKAYELEGLLLMAFHREDLPVEVGELICKKCQEISSDVVKVFATQSENEYGEETDIPDDKEQEVLEDEEAEEETTEADEMEGEEIEEDESEEDADESEEDADESEEIEEDESEENVEESEEIRNEIEEDVEEETEKKVYEDEIREEVEDDEGPFYNLEDDEEITPVKKEPEISSPVSSATSRREPPKFSLNDKFLFIRELFKGNAASFYDAIDHLQNFKNADEAEAYFIERLQLDVEEPAAARFLETIRSSF